MARMKMAGNWAWGLSRDYERRPPRRSKAAVIVEAAVVMPSMIILTFMMIQYGLLLNLQVTLSHAARDTARYAACHPATDTPIRDYLQNHLPQHLHWDDLTFAISPAQGSSSRTTKNPITVTLTYDANAHMFLGTTFFGIPLPGSTMSSSAIMMIE